MRMSSALFATALALTTSVSAVAAAPKAATKAPLRTQAPTSTGTQSSTPGPEDYVFPTGAGVLFFYVKPDHTVDFETVVARLSAALDASQDPVRKQQAQGWHMLRSVEAIHDAAIYVFVFDPAVAGASYDPVKILSDALPAESQGLYTKLKDSIIRVERMGLVRLR